MSEEKEKSGKDREKLLAELTKVLSDIKGEVAAGKDNAPDSLMKLIKSALALAPTGLIVEAALLKIVERGVREGAKTTHMYGVAKVDGKRYKCKIRVACKEKKPKGEEGEDDVLHNKN